MFTCLKKRHKKERCVLPLGVLCFSSFNDMHRLLNKKKIQIHLGFFHIFYYKHVCCNFVARSNLNCVAEISKKKKKILIRVSLSLVIVLICHHILYI